jgi:hypothetical protein
VVFAAVAEAGLALLVVPSPVGQLLFGQQLVGVAIPVVRVTGIGLNRPKIILLASHTSGRAAHLQRGRDAVSYLHRVLG